MSSTAVPRVVPAQLSFLAVYNPALGRSDEEFHQQIVFYYSKAAKARAKLPDGDEQAAHDLREQENEKLRQVGLAQGMVGFARSFSNGAPVDSVETHKSRIVLKELEDGWWILASIDFTQLPAPASADPAAPTVEYSSREVSPPALLIQQLVRTHSTFTLHHGWPLDELLRRYGRPKFCSLMDKYWSRFASTWDVMLHASPAVDMYRGLKLAAGGELGMGVGEEDWGSSERDVLENFARRTEGLVDVMVSRFGEPSPLQHVNSSPEPSASDRDSADPWLGGGKYPTTADGVVFSGLGALSRSSLRDVSHWVESIYYYGDLAYGVRDNPTSDRTRRRRRNPNSKADSSHAASSPINPATDNTPSPISPDPPNQDLPPGIPPPIVKAVESSLDKASAAVDSNKSRDNAPSKHESGQFLASLGDTDTWVKYMTLGYGTAWGGKKQENSETSVPVPAKSPTPEQASLKESQPTPMRHVEPEVHVDVAEDKWKLQVQHENDGYFLIGLKGDMSELAFDDDNDEGNWNSRIPLRTLYVEEVSKSSSEEDLDPIPDYEKELSFNSSEKLERARVRPIVYVVSLNTIALPMSYN